MPIEPKKSSKSKSSTSKTLEGTLITDPETGEEKRVMKKGEFARARGRTAKQVTVWLKKGVITDAAIVGFGRNALIWVEQADRDLAENMDPRYVGDLENLSATPSGTKKGFQPAARRRTYTDSDNLSRKRKAEADQAEMKAEQTRRQMAIDAGRYIEKEAAARAWGRELQELMQNIEVWAATSMPQEIAAELSVDWKRLSAAVRKSFRSFRQDVIDRKKKVSEDERVPG